MTTNDTNVTNEEIEWIPGLQLAACIFYTIILLVGVTGNILVIIIVAKYRHMKNATNFLLTNLSVADLFLLLFCTAEGYQHLYAKDKHRLGTFMCRFSPFVQNVTATCSVLTIIAISYERYVAICRPLKAAANLTVFRTLPTVIVFWVVSCLASAPFFAFTNTHTVESTYDELIVTCFTHFPSPWSTWYLIPCTLIIYLITLVMLCYWYYAICHILFNREALLSDNTVVTRYRRQVAQLLIALIVSFFVLILPHKIWALIQPQLSIEQFHKLGFHRHTLLIIGTRSLLYLNSAINPLLYSIMSTKFRQSFAQLCGGCYVASNSDHLSGVHFRKGSSMRPKSTILRKKGPDEKLPSATKAVNRPAANDIENTPEHNCLITDNQPTPINRL